MSAEMFLLFSSATRVDALPTLLNESTCTYHTAVADEGFAVGAAGLVVVVGFGSGVGVAVGCAGAAAGGVVDGAGVAAAAPRPSGRSCNVS